MKCFRYLVASIVLLCISVKTFAQVNIGDKALIDTSSVLQLTSTNKGLLIPRLTIFQRNAIKGPANGLIIYDITTNKLEYNAGNPLSPSWVILTSYTISNGLTQSNDSILLGGTLVQPTQITTSATNTLALQGLRAGLLTDSFVTIDPFTGVLRQKSINALVLASNGLTKLKDSILLGGTLNKTTTIATNGDTLAIIGLPSGLASDSLVTIDFATGALKRRTTAGLVNVGNGLTKSNDSILLGGTLNRATAIATSGTNTLAITGLGQSNDQDSLVTVNGNGVLSKNAISTFVNASNGLTKLKDSILLGGTLNRTTTIATNGDTLAIIGLPSGLASDSLVTIDFATGTLKRRTTAGLVNAGNGLTKLKDSILLGGMLNKTTTIATNGDTLAIKGLPSGLASDSLVTIDFATGALKRRTTAGLVNVGNGLTKSNDSILLGGTLNRATAIATSGTNTLAITGLGQSNDQDSLVTVNGNGVLSKNAISTFVNASNGLTKLKDSILLGGTLNRTTTIATNGDTLAIIGLPSGLASDSLVTIDFATGALKRRTTAGLVNVGNGLTKSNDSILLGGTLNRATAIATSGTNTLAITGLGQSNDQDSLVTVNGNGVLSKNAISTFVNASNGLTKLKDSILLGGTLNRTTTIATNGDTLAIKGLPSGLASDSLVTIDFATGTLKRRTTAGLVNAGNALTKLNDSILLGGTLNRATAIATSGTNTLAITGLGQSNDQDSLVTVNGNGVLSKNAISTFVNASNGLTKLKDSILLGGMLNKTTTIATNGDTLAIKGLPSGLASDSLVTIDFATGALKRRTTAGLVNVGNGLTKSNDSILLGGTLNRATAIATSGTNTLAITGLGQSNDQDSLVTVNGNGVLSKNAISTFVNASNGLTKLKDSILLGGMLNKTTTIATNGDTLAIIGLPSGLVSDSLVTIDFATGTLKRRTTAGLVNAGNGLTKLNDSILLGGALNRATAIATSGTNTLAITGLGQSNDQDSLVTVNGNGVLSKNAISTFVNASNGLTKLKDSILLGGTLNRTTTIATNGDTLAIIGLPSGLASDSLVTIDFATGTLKRRTTAGLVNAGNALTKLNDSILLGGTLNRATAIATSGTNTLAITGLGQSNDQDSLVTVNGNGVLSKNAISTFVNASNGLTKLKDSILLGGTLNRTTTISTNGDTLAIIGLPSGLASDSLVTIDFATGTLKRRTTAGLVNVGNGLTKLNDFILLGGALNRATAIATSGTNTLAITGLGQSNDQDSLVTVNGNGVLSKNAISTFVNASNGLTKLKDSILLGGTLNRTTTIATNGDTLAIIGLPSGLASDSLVTIDFATGTLKRRTTAGLVNVGNGLMKSNDSILLGGALNRATAIATSGTNTLAITGLGQSNDQDSLVTVNGNGVLSKNAISTFVNASNGLTKLKDSILLGGTLNRTTTIATNGDTLAIIGLPSGLASDSLVTIDFATGTLKRRTTAGLVNVGNGLMKSNDSILLGGALNRATAIATSGTNTLAITGLGQSNDQDSLVTVNGNGVLSKNAINTFVNASNGLTKLKDSILLGGMLNKTTTIATNGDTLAIKGLPSGLASDSLVTIDFATGTLKRRTTAGLVNVGNGLTKSNDSILLGGALNRATAIATSGTNTLAITGLGQSNDQDSLVTVNGNGVLSKNAISTFVNASNGLTKLKDSILLGGTLNRTTTIATNGDTLAIKGLPSGLASDSLVTIDFATGTLKRRTTAGLVNVGNGLTKSNDSILLGGALNRATAIATSGTNTLAITGLGQSNDQDSLVTVNGNGVLSKNAISTFVNASNGLTKLKDSILLGGMLNRTTTIATNGDTLAIKGLPSGLASDSLVTIDFATGTLKRRTTAGLVNVGNGLTKSNDSILLGGALNRATAIATSGTNTLAITGLGQSNDQDSLVTVNGNGVLSKNAISTFVNASNGLTKLKDSILLGGMLNRTTTIATNGDTLAITGLPSGLASDSLVTIDFATGALKRRTTAGLVNVGNGLMKSNDSILLGGALNRATAIATSGTNTLAITGLGQSNDQDSLVTVNGNGVLSKNAISTFVNASNGLTKLKDSILLGGTLNRTTMIATNGDTLAIKGLPSGLASDSLVTIDFATGTLKRRTTAGLVNVGNGLMKSNDSILLGGALNRATAIATSGTNTLAITGLGQSNDQDSLVTVNGNGVLSKNAINTFVNASNGLTKLKDSILLGGMLNKTTTIATNGDTLAIKGLPSGLASDSLVTIDFATGTLKRRTTAGLVNVGNGLTKSNDSILLGGALNRATAIATSGTNTLAITGLGQSNDQDSLVTVNGNGVLSKNAISTFVNASNGLTKLKDSILLGGMLNRTTTIATNGDTLAIKGLPSGLASDSLVTIDFATGTLKRRTTAGLVNVGNGLTKSNDSILLGGALNRATAIATSGTNTLAITGLGQSNDQDSLVTVNGNGVLSKNAISTFVNASNGLTKLKDSILLGGMLNRTTTIATNGDTLAITGLPSGLASDSLVTIDFATGALKRRTTAGLVNVGNGLMKSNDSILLGGALNRATAIATSGTNTLAITGLGQSNDQDSLVTVNGNGVLSKNAISTFVNASNGLTKLKDSILLGGTLNRTTMIATNGDTLAIKGLPSGLASDSLVTIDFATGTLKRRTTAGLVNVGNGLMKSNDSILLGGALNRATAIATSGTNTLAITGLGQSNDQDSLVTVNGNGVLSKNAISTFVNASNGLTKLKDSILLGGMLNRTTTIATNGDTLAITGLPSGLASDSLVTIDFATGALKRRTTAGLVNVGNGLMKSNDSILLGGALNRATAIATSGTNTLAITGLGQSNDQDSLVTVNGNGVLSKNAISTFVNASNGLTKLKDSILLGGTLNRTTMIATNGDTLAIKGLPSGLASDSLVTIDFATGTLKRRTTAGLVNVGNGLMKSNDSILLGGALNRATAIATSGTNTLAITGLGQSNDQDSLVTVNGNGVLSKNAISTFVNASNGLTKLKDSILLGGTLNRTTTIATNGDTLAIKGLPSGLASDSLVTIDFATGALKRRTTAGLVNAGNALTKLNDSILLGGTLNRATAIATSGTNTLAITGLGQSNDQDSLVTVNGNGVLSKNAINTFVNASNGLTKLKDSILLGGMLNRTTTIATNGDTLAIKGLPSGLASDSLVTIDFATGTLKRRTTAGLVNAGNGLTKLNDSILLGGALNRATAIATSGTNTLAITGLGQSNDQDSLVTVNGNGVLSKNAISTFVNASNGLTKLKDSILLGGTLNKTTTIATNGDTLAIKGLPSGLASDSLVTIDFATGTLKRRTTAGLVNASNGLTKLKDSILLGGTLNRTTTIATNGDTLAIKGLPSGLASDSLVTIDFATGTLKRRTTAGLVNAGNGLTKSNDSILLGGALNRATAIATSGTNTLAITGLGQSNDQDSLVTVNGNGVLSKNAISTFVNASNGLTKLKDSILLGGMLNRTTTIATNGDTLAIKGLPSGLASDSLVTIDFATGTLKRRTTAGLVNASNGLTKLNDSILLGGTLNRTTTIATNGDTLAIKGLPSGLASDSLVTIDFATGTLKRRTTAGLVNAGNGLTKLKDSILLGGTLNRTTTIATSGDTLAITGLPSGLASDSLVTIDFATGTLKRRTTAGLVNAGNGLTKSNDSILLGGTLNRATTIVTTATNTLAVGGLQSGTINSMLLPLNTDSLLTLNPANGVIRQFAPNRLAWLLGGNTGINSANNFIGTIDNNPLVFKVNNVGAAFLGNLVNNPSNAFFGIGAGNINTNASATILANNYTANAGLGSVMQAVLGTAGIVDSNTAVGTGVLSTTTTSFKNTGVGVGILGGASIGTSNVGIGVNVLNGAGGSLLNNNVAIGVNVSNGSTAVSNTVAIGNGALQNNTINNTVAIGTNALQNNNGSSNFAIGNFALQFNTTGTNNFAIGNSALQSNKSSSGNLAIGLNALQSYNVIGVNALNVAIGQSAGRILTTGINNSFIGQGSGNFIQSASNNTVIGSNSFFSGSTATGDNSNNTIIGSNILPSASSASPSVSNSLIIGVTPPNSASFPWNQGLGSVVNSIAIGNNIYFPTLNANNQLNIGNIIGGLGFNTTSNSFGAGSIGIGVFPTGSTTGIPSSKLQIGNFVAGQPAMLIGNTPIWDDPVSGSATDDNLTIGNQNLAGAVSGATSYNFVSSAPSRPIQFRLINNLTSTAGFYYTNDNNSFFFFRQGTGNTASSYVWKNSLAFGADPSNSNNGLTLMVLNGDGSLYSRTTMNATAFNVLSDERVKTNIRPYQKGIADLMKINPVSYNFNGKYGSVDDHRIHVGVLAQDLEKILPNAVNSNDRNGLKDFRTVDYQGITMTLVNAVKQQEDTIQQIKKENSKLKQTTIQLKQENDQLNERVSRLENMMKELLDKNTDKKNSK